MIYETFKGSWIEKIWREDIKTEKSTIAAAAFLAAEIDDMKLKNVVGL